MVKKKTIQKLVSFESNGKDFSSLNKYLSEGWHISETMPHPNRKNVHFCVLKKDVVESQLEPAELTVKEVLDIVNIHKPKKVKETKEILQESKQDKQVKEKILEDA